MTVGVALASVSSRPSAAILHACRALVCPAGIIEIGGNGVSGRRDRQQVDDHGLVESGEAVIDVPGPLRRPVPVESAALWRAAIPIPLDGFPEMRNARIEVALGLAWAVEILARRQQ